jgi:hypothetical protein
MMFISHHFDASGPRIDLLVQPDLEDAIILERDASEDEAVVELLVGVTPGRSSAALGQNNQLAALRVEERRLELILVGGHLHQSRLISNRFDLSGH